MQHLKYACLWATSLIALWGACAPTLSPDIGNDNANTNDNVAPDSNENANGSTEPDEPQVSTDALPGFSLPDVNPQSPRSGENVSPRDYLGQVSAWYFGHAT